MIYSKKYLEYDALFLKEITELFIFNLIELNEGLSESIHTNDPHPYTSKFLRSKVTLSLIGNQKLFAIAENIDESLRTEAVSEINRLTINSFRNLCNKEIKSLSARLIYYKNYLVTSDNIG